ncbi:MAG: TolB protein [Chloroflexota bacterium]|nr:TolB protein [Chloroflexota bacterium]
MTLDDRARHAAREFRRVADTMHRAGDDQRPFDRFDRFRQRRQRTQRFGVIAVAAAVSISASFVAIRAFPTADQKRPAHAWSVNGRIVFGRSAPNVDETRLFSILPDGSHELALPVSFTDCAEWSPDGTQMHLTASEYPGSRLRPAVVRADGTGFTLLDATTDANLNLGCGDWTPDASRLVLEGFPQAGDPSLNGIYSVRSSDGGDLEVLSGNPYGGYDAVPQVSLADGSIVFLRTDPARQLPNDVGALFVMRTDGSGLRRITPWGLAASSGGWSPDGQWIAFTTPSRELYLVHPDGTGLAPMTVDLPAGAPTQPRWSPDGAELVFGLRTNNRGDIYTVAVEGSDLTQITDTPTIDERWPDWGTNGG